MIAKSVVLGGLIYLSRISWAVFRAVFTNAAVAVWTPAAILTNCLPVDAVPQVLREIRNASSDGPAGVYANVGFADENGQWINTDSVNPEVYAAHGQRWLEAGASLIGSCCGTTPAHIAELRRRVDQMSLGHAEP